MKKLLLGLGAIITAAMPVAMGMSYGAPEKKGYDSLSVSVTLKGGYIKYPNYSESGLLKLLEKDHAKRFDTQFEVYNDDNKEQINDYLFKWDFDKAEMISMYDSFIKECNLSFRWVDYSEIKWN